MDLSAAACGTSCCQEVAAGGDATELGCTAAQRGPGPALPCLSACWGHFWKVSIHLLMSAGVSIAVTSRWVMQGPAASLLQAMRV